VWMTKVDFQGQREQLSFVILLRKHPAFSPAGRLKGSDLRELVQRPNLIASFGILSYWYVVDSEACSLSENLYFNSFNVTL